ncbi:MAG: uncharacterized protein JWQ97_487 [Phenylobacterium sp.]|nr:uncharacterized protein [Phenylobacterium sp.]
MDLLPNPEQQQVADSVAAFLRAEAPVARLLDRARSHPSAERSLWTRYAELGWFGLGLPEALGGVGYAAPEDLLLFRAIGRFLATPNVLAARIGAEVAARAGDQARARAILAGEVVVAIANPAGRCRIGPRASGRFHLLDGRPGDLLLTWSDDGAALFPFGAFEGTEATAGLDEGVELSVGALHDVAADAWVSADDQPLPTFAMVMVAAMLCGVAEAALQDALDYVKLREQFGRKIGSFQAVKHRCADMALATEAAWAQSMMAALSLGRGKPAADFEAAAAKFVATDAALKCAAANIQLHGGLGFTAECEAHLFTKRARLLEQIGGARRLHRSKLIAPSMQA